MRRLRWVSVFIPGSRWRLELLEFTEIDRKPVMARPQDPGAMTLVLQVRDVDALLAKLKEAQVSGRHARRTADDADVGHPARSAPSR